MVERTCGTAVQNQHPQRLPERNQWNGHSGTGFLKQTVLGIVPFRMAFEQCLIQSECSAPRTFCGRQPAMFGNLRCELPVMRSQYKLVLVFKQHVYVGDIK